MIAWISIAFAAPPDGGTQNISVGTGNISKLAVSSDGEFVAGVSQGDNNAFLFSIDAWASSTVSGCSVQAVAFREPADTGDDELHVACADGSIRFWNGSSLVEAEPIEDLTTPHALFYDFTVDELYAVGTGPTVIRVNPETGEQIGDTIEILQSGFVDAVVDPFAPGVVYIAHGGFDISSVTPATGTATFNNLTTGLRPSIDDLSISPAGLYCIDGGGNQLAEYVPASLLFNTVLASLDAPTAIGWSLAWVDDADDQGNWIILSGDTIQVYELSTTSVPPDTEPFWESATTEVAIDDIVVANSGYTFGGAQNGNLFIATANPLVSDIVVTPASALAGDTVTIEFVVSEDADYDVYVGGDRFGTGTQLASGSATADETASAEFTVTTGFAEGANPLYIVATDLGANSGHGVGSVAVDNPPEAVALAQGNVGFSDGALVLTFDALPAEDIVRYDVYVTTEPFDPEDYGAGTTGGPAFDGSDEITNPFTGSGSGTVSVRIEPLTNEQTYYLGVRAVDASQEGPMSNIVSDRPRETYSASELAGETGGSNLCAASGAGGWMLLATGLVALRRRLPGLAAATLLLAPLATSTAHAQDAEEDDGKKARSEDRANTPKYRDLTRQVGNFEVRYGTLDLTDNNIESVYGKRGNNMFRIEFGPQFFRFVELDFGLGFFQELDTKVDADGITGASEVTMLTMYPMTLDGTFRLQLIDEQPIVPHIRGGFDYVFWNEKWDDGAGGKNKRFGVKTGTHWALGAGLLLDIFSPSRASLLEAQTGINDTYLQFEWRKMAIDSRDNILQKPDNPQGFEFGGTSFTVGLKFDY